MCWKNKFLLWVHLQPRARGVVRRLRQYAHVSMLWWIDEGERNYLELFYVHWSPGEYQVNTPRCEYRGDVPTVAVRHELPVQYSLQ